MYFQAGATPPQTACFTLQIMYVGIAWYGNPGLRVKVHSHICTLLVQLPNDNALFHSPDPVHPCLKYIHSWLFSTCQRDKFSNFDFYQIHNITEKEDQIEEHDFTSVE